MEIKDDRAEVLAAVRASLKGALLPSARASIPPREVTQNANGGDLVEQFARELDALGVHVYRPATAAQAREIVVGLVCADQTSSVVNLLAWESGEIPLAGLEEALAASRIERLDASIPSDPEQGRIRLGELGQASVGLTGALAALADSGTLVLLSGPARPRLASLLPPVHIAVVAASRIYPNMASLFAAQPDAAREFSNLVFITGPSRSADIEQTLTLGVHGPRQVHVVLVQDNADR